MDYRKLQELYERDGEARFSQFVVNDLIHTGKLNASNFSLRGLWEAMGRPDLNRGKRMLGLDLTEAEFKESMDSSAFPKVTGALINRVVMDAYEQTYGAGMQLVSVIPSSQRDDVVVGFTAADSLAEVEEGMPYEQGDFGEKYHKIRNRKWGRILALSEEMVKFDQTGQMVQRAQRIGENARAKQDEIIMEVICGTVNSGVNACWRPAATATTLYSDTSTDPYDASNPKSTTFDNVNTNNLVDETDIDENMALLAAATDEKGRPIAVNPAQLVCGWGKIMVARRILESTNASKLTTPAGVVNTYAGQIQSIVSPWVTNKLSAAYWLLGEFKKQFIYTEVFPLQVFQAKPGSEDEWLRDTVFGFKARFMGGCGAVSNKFVIRSTGAS